MSTRRVLVVGYRQGLTRALAQREIPFAVWHNAPMRTLDAKIPSLVAPFGSSYDTAREAAKQSASLGAFSHVIAATESSVLAASFARRVLGARRSTHTTVMRCHDKLAMKQHLAEFGIPMAPFGDGNDPAQVQRLARAARKVVVKDRRSSGGRGIRVVEGDPTRAAVPTRNRIVEGFIEAPELSVESFVHAGRVCFTNITQYVENKHVNAIPAQLPGPLEREILDLNARAIEALSIEWGMTHLEMYLPEDGPLFGEIALRPPGGYIMEILSLAYDFDAWQAFLAVELGEAPQIKTTASACAAAVILHPGRGKLERIEGLKAAKRIEAVEKLRLRVRVGARIEARSGVGEDVGYALLRARDRPSLDAALKELDATLAFVLH